MNKHITVVVMVLLLASVCSLYAASDSAVLEIRGIVQPRIGIDIEQTFSSNRSLNEASDEIGINITQQNNSSYAYAVTFETLSFEAAETAADSSVYQVNGEGIPVLPEQSLVYDANGNAFAVFTVSVN